jgi:hypothetical protein
MVSTPTPTEQRMQLLQQHHPAPRSGVPRRRISWRPDVLHSWLSGLNWLNRLGRTPVVAVGWWWTVGARLESLLSAGNLDAQLNSMLRRSDGPTFFLGPSSALQGIMPNFQGISAALAISGSSGPLFFRPCDMSCDLIDISVLPLLTSTAFEEDTQMYPYSTRRTDFREHSQLWQRSFLCSAHQPSSGSVHHPAYITTSFESGAGLKRTQGQDDPRSDPHPTSPNICSRTGDRGTAHPPSSL